jgi:very-short-patch-repair endonuclease
MNNEKEIVDMYTKQCKSTYQISKELNTYPNKIRRVLQKHGVELKDRSAAQKNALEQGVSKIPTQGQKRTEKDKIKISKSMKKRWDTMTEEEHKRRIDIAKERWYNLTESEKQLMSQAATKGIQRAGKEGSKLEKFIGYELSKEGFVVEPHKKNLIPNENLEIDIYLPELKSIVEIDGPSHFLPIWGEEKLHKQIKADENKTGLILSKGFVIIRVKYLSRTLCLSDQHKLKDELIRILTGFKDKLPQKSKRYIELEV